MCTAARPLKTMLALLLAASTLAAACARSTAAPSGAAAPLGALEQIAGPDGRTVYFPKQPPSEEAMMALLEGVLVERDGCLRVAGSESEPGFLVLWWHDYSLHVSSGVLEVRDGLGRAVARAGAPVRIAGGAMELPGAQANYDRQIPGLPLAACPGPYWVAGPLETLEEQAVPDVYVDPYSSGGRSWRW